MKKNEENGVLMPINIDDKNLKLIQKKYSDLINYQSDNFDDPIDPINYIDSGGDRLIHIAAMRGDNDTISILIKCGIDPNIRGEMNFTPLHYAAQFNHQDTIKFLIFNGAKKYLKNDFGLEPDIDGAM